MEPTKSNSEPTVPFMDLKAQYQSIKKEIDFAIHTVLDNADFIGGKKKFEFEAEFAAACRTKHCIGMANGTDAIFIGLMAAGIGTGDEVIVPANSFIATSEAVTVTGAKPVFVDVDEKTYLIDLQKTEDLLKTKSKKVGGKISAIIAVHLYGQLCDMKGLLNLCEKYDVLLFEDSAQAHLAEINGKRAGSFGIAATFSFYPGKNLGAYGDAGALVTNDDRVAETARRLANHGRVGKYDHSQEGFNSRLDTIQAAILSVKLKHLENWTAHRIAAARRYDELLAGHKHLILPNTPASAMSHVYHLYVVQVENRNELQERLSKAGIQTIVHYPIALPNLKAYEKFKHSRNDFPVSSKLESKIISLPLFPEITVDQQKWVAKHL
jgi:dTDP-4-amino-4,6-dideoxygalactose transaminase